ncbi:MAG: replicative DNA helicase [Rhodocyclaceae bacterium]|nr:replicative DNA helicase [Rhodocyclaceae bacterium]
MSVPDLYSHEAETALLGSLLLDDGSWDEVTQIIAVEDFFLAQHRLIFAAMAELAQQGQRIDTVSVWEVLRRQGQVERVGDMAYLGQLAQAVLPLGRIQQYCHIMRELALLRQLAAAGIQIAQLAHEGGQRSLAQRLAEAEQCLMQVSEKAHGLRAQGTSFAQLVIDSLDKLDARCQNPSAITGLPTGYIDLDRKLGGLQRGDLIILAARPSMGKTSLALNIAEHAAARHGAAVAVFSMEMSAEQLVQRMIASLARVDQQRLRTANLGHDDWARLADAVDRLRSVRIEIDETPGQTLAQMRASARRLARQMGGKLDLIVVDYLQLMSGSGENRVQEISEISRGLKLLAREMDCPVLALSQLNRSVEQRVDKRPLLSDLRESGSLEQDADQVLFIYRDDYYNKDSAERGMAEVIIAKNRNGPVGVIKLAFLGHLTRFEDLAVA